MAWDFLQRLKGGFSKNKESVLKHRPLADKSAKMSRVKNFQKEKESERTKDAPDKEIRHIDRPISDIASAALSAPHISEKAAFLSENNTYVFRVSADASKPELRRAIEDRYKVAVDKVRIVNVPTKKRRRGQILGTKPGYKKAIVALQKGQSIETY